jgi:predicted DNA-binding transcriptional regulator AlpA
MKRNVEDSVLLKGSEVCRLLGLGNTAGYRYLAHLQKHEILKPIKLPALKTPRWRKDEVEALANNRDEIECPEFAVN